MEDYKPTINAKTIDEFKKIEDKLKKLPKSVYGCIDIVENDELLCALTCKMRQTNSSNSRMYLPKFTTQIMDFDNYIGVYAKDYFFKIPKENKIDIIFVDE